jgi:predicted transcriptional regulator of viral defense system
MRKSAVERARVQILSFFDNMPQHVFTFHQLANIFETERITWSLPESMTIKKFMTFLTDRGSLTTHRFDFNWLPTTLYYWGDPTVYEVAMSLRPNSYLCHLTAAQFHGLVPAEPRDAVYVNVEQTPKPGPTGKLEQASIDTAFKRPSRTTQNRVQVGNHTFYLLSGKHTNMLGVESRTTSGLSLPVRVTSLERTLIDIVVRPIYAGGVQTILEAYKRAAKQLDVGQMTRILEQLQHLYPYHQAIGFFMERSQSYSSTQIELLHKYPKNYDFYADYQITEPRYSPAWHLYYPSSLDT